MLESYSNRARIANCNRPISRVPASVGGNGGNVTSAGWQVTLCDPVWHASSRSGEASCYCYTSFTFTLSLNRSSYRALATVRPIIHQYCHCYRGWRIVGALRLLLFKVLTNVGVSGKTDKY